MSPANPDPDQTATDGRPDPGGSPAGSTPADLAREPQPETPAGQQHPGSPAGQQHFGTPAGPDREAPIASYPGTPADPGTRADPGTPADPWTPAGSEPGAPASPYPVMPAGPVEPRRPGRAFAVGAAATVVLIALGALLGLIWYLAAPDVPVIKTDRGVFATQPEPEEFIASDGWFTLLGLGFGVLAAIALWLLLRRYRGPIGMIVLAVGGIGAAVVAWQVGRRIGLGEYHHLVASAPAGQTFVKPPDLRAGGFTWLYGVLPVVRGNLLMPAFGAVVTYTLLAGWSRWPSLQPEPAEVAWEPPAAPTG